MRKLFYIALAGLMPLAMNAQTLGTEAMPFVHLDYNPASLAMGSTMAPTAAVLPLSDFTLAAGGAYKYYMPDISGTKYYSGGVAGKYGKFGAAVSFTRGTGEEISGSGFTPAEILVNGGAAYAFTTNLSAGVNVLYAKEQLLSDYSNSAVAFDAFVAGRFDAIDFFAGVSSMGGKVSSESTGDFSLPSAAVAGVGYGIDIAEYHAVSARIKADYFLSGAFAAGIGAEYSFDKLIFARVGYHYGGESVVPSFASAGFGFHNGMFCLDAAYLFGSDVLNNSFSVSVGVRF